MRLFTLLALLLLVHPARAQPGQPSLAPEAERVLIHAGVLLDRPGREARRRASILIANGRIEAVRDGFIEPSEGTRLIDLSDRFVLPGLIDSHVHLTSDRAGVEGVLAEVTDSIALRSQEAAWNARKTLDAGFTTVRNLGSGDGITLGLREAIARGWAQGPRILDSGTSLSATTGHMDPTLGVREEFHDVLREEGSVCDGADDCRRAVRRQIARGADLIKIATTGGVNSRIGLGLGAQMFEDEVRAIVETAHLYGRKVAVHAHGADGIALALQAGADSIEHGTMIDDDVLRIWRGRKTYYVPTLSTVNGYIERLRNNPGAYSGEVREKIEWRIGITGQSLRRAVPAGIPIAFGTDAGVSLHGRNADEFLLMVEHGMTTMAAIEAATVNAADLLGISDQAGSIETGKVADIIAVRGDPLADIGILRAVDFVMARGRVHRQDP